MRGTVQGPGQDATPFLWPPVRLIETSDSIRNGLLKGAIIGGLFGLASAIANDCSSNECGEVFYVLRDVRGPVEIRIVWFL
jgi:hypothetical protein